MAVTEILPASSSALHSVSASEQIPTNPRTFILTADVAGEAQVMQLP